MRGRSRWIRSEDTVAKVKPSASRLAATCPAGSVDPGGDAGGSAAAQDALERGLERVVDGGVGGKAPPTARRRSDGPT